MNTVDTPTKDRADSAERSAVMVAEEISNRIAKDVVVLDVRGQSDFTDYFVIATAETPRHLDYLARHAGDALRGEKLGGVRREGQSDGGWLLLDGGAVTVHLLTVEQREHYRLEELWAAAVEVARYA